MQTEMKEKEDAQKKELMMEMEEGLKQFKRNERIMLKEKDGLASEFELLTKTLKEKQQLHRISAYKLNELKRDIK